VALPSGRVALAAPALLLCLAARPGTGRTLVRAVVAGVGKRGQLPADAGPDGHAGRTDRGAGERLRESEEARQKTVSPLSWNGYVDFGFFVPIGNDGVGWMRDAGNAQFPSTPTTRGRSWATSWDTM
jgi:hypothetical protein